MKRLVIACSIMKEELLHCPAEDVSFVFLEQSLHRTPQKMKEAIQEEIHKAEQWDGDDIVLGYGLCSNGVLGIRSNRHPLLIPRVHDCIAMFLGSAERFQEEHRQEPGTYYLTRGWIEEGKSPLRIFEEYCGRYRREMAEWAIREELKHYTRIALVETGLGITEAHREHARENARFFNLRFEEIKGSLAFFEKMLPGSCNGDLIRLAPGEAATQEMFLGNGPA